MKTLISTKHLSRGVVEGMLDDDESYGYAVALVRIGRGQTAWQPDPGRTSIVGPCSVVYERQFGVTKASAA